MAKADKLPTIAQARQIAAIWGSHSGRIKVIESLRSGESAYLDPTKRVCVARKWLVPDGPPTKMEGGAFYREYAVTITALDALEDFLRETRLKTNMRKLEAAA